MYEPPPRYFYWGQKPTWDKNTLNQQKHIKFVLNRSNNKKNVKFYHCFKDSYPCFQTMNLILKSNLTMFFIQLNITRDRPKFIKVILSNFKNDIYRVFFFVIINKFYSTLFIPLFSLQYRLFMTSNFERSFWGMNLHERS